jgi:hypothetical protein
MHLILPSPFSPEGINIAQQLPQSALQLALAQLLFSTKYRVVAWYRQEKNQNIDTNPGKEDPSRWKWTKCAPPHTLGKRQWQNRNEATTSMDTQQQ